MYNDELTHFGILGMKWGVRRSKSQLGKDSESKKVKSEEDDGVSTGKKTASSSGKSKKTPEFSDEELSQKVRRLQLEKQYRDLLPKEEVKVNKGKEIAKEILINSGKSAASTIATAAFTYAGKQMVKKAAGEQIYKEIFSKDKKKD